MSCKPFRFVPVLCIILICCPAFAQQEYKSPYWGISLTFPDNWIRMTDEESVQNFEEHIRLDSNYTRIILASQHNKISLFTAIQQNPDETAGVIATIKIAAHKNPAKSFDEFSKGMDIMLGGMFKIFKNGRYIAAPHKTTLSNVPVIYCEMAFTVDSQNDGPMQIRNRVYCMPMPDYFLIITMMYAPGDKETAALYDNIVKTIQLNPAKYMQ